MILDTTEEEEEKEEEFSELSNSDVSHHSM